jgi:outer membrane lipoprotein-sorting protein
MVIKRYSFLQIFLFFCLFCNAYAKVTPETILEKADAIRNPSKSFVMQVKISSRDGKDVSEFEVFTKGKDKTLIKTLSPRRDQGRNFLMLEQNMWAYIPNLKRAVRVSLAQKLTGQAANGDISRMTWSGDYDALIESEDKKEWILYLKAKKKGLTYDKLRVWINKENFRPISAEYLTVTDKKLKLATYKNYKMMAGKVRPSKIEIRDALKENNISIITISKMKVKNLPASLFNRNSLK